METEIAPRRPVGRPRIDNRDPLVTIRMPQGMIDQIDIWRHANGHFARSEGIRRLIDEGLPAKLESLSHDA